MKEANWEFAPTGGGAIDGIHNPLISHFTGNYNYHLAREIIQNSLDAWFDRKNPVEVKFNLENFTKNEFPGYNELIDIFKLCKEFWPSNNTDVQDFISSALKCLNQEKIVFLKCSDYNTVGLYGNDDEINGSWFNLVKSRGSSSKYKGEGGSFGIGKGAPFAASNVRVLFYYTRNKNAWSIFQGVAELISFKKDNEIRRGSGSFGINGHSSIRKIEEIPERFWRKSNISPGLDIYVSGFKQHSDWKKELAQSVLRNFWYAIHKKELVVEVDNILISKNTLEKLLVDNFSGESLKDDIEPIGNPLKFYEAIKNGKHFSETLPTLGNVEFYFTEIEDHMNYVAMMRQPHMVVFSKPYRYPGSYCGVFICDDDNGNKILRKMEPPTHNRWEPDSYGTTGIKILNEVHEWIRGIIKSQQKVKRKEILDIPELYKYLPFDDGQELGDGKGKKEYSGHETDTETSKLIQKKENQESDIKISPYKVSIINEPEITGLGGGLRGIGKKKKRKNGKGVGGDEDSNKALTYKEVEIIPFVVKKISLGYEYLIKVKSDSERSCRLSIYAIGDEGSEKISILKAFDKTKKEIHSSGNKINRIHLYANTIYELYVQIRSSSKYALRINAYDI